MEHHEKSYIEPQVVNAAKVMEGKGYRVGILAGSAGSPDDGKQAIVFDYPQVQLGEDLLVKEIMTKLAAFGVRQYSGAIPVGTIGFEFDTKGVSDVEKRWLEIAEALPEVKA